MRISDWSSDVCSSDLILLNQSNLQGILVVGIHKPTQHGECQGRDSSRDQPLNRTESHLRNRIGFSHMHTTLTLIIDTILSILAHWTRKDRKTGVEGTSVYVRVDPGGRCIIKKNTKYTYIT